MKMLAKYAQILHLKNGDYSSLAKNIQRMKNIPEYKRLQIIEEANNKIPQTPQLESAVEELAQDMFNSREFYNSRKEYSQGFPKYVLISAIADFIIRTKPELVNQ